MLAPRTQPQPAHLGPQVPDELTRREQWIAWRWGRANKQGKRDKVPIDPTTGQACNDKDPRFWRSYSEARAAAQRWRAAGVGFCFTDDDDLVGLDLDDVIRAGVLDPAAAALLARLPTYAEYSPSGTGVKLWVRGTLLRNIQGPLGEGHIEIYAHQRFFTVTGRRIEGAPLAIADGQAVLDALAAELAPPPAPIDDTPRALALPRPAAPKRTHQGRADAQAVITQFNADHALPELLERYGAPLRSQRGDSYTFGGLPGDQHGHDVTLKVSRRRDATGWIGFSYSPNSRLAGARGFDAFAVYCIVEHNGDRVAALRAINPIMRAAAAPAPPPAPQPPEGVPTAEQLARRAADAARKRSSRLDEATATRASLEARAAQDEHLGGRGQIALLALLEACGDGAATRWSNARLAALAGFSERYIRSGLSELERAGYFTCDTHANAAGEAWRGGAGTVWRTLVRWHGDQPAPVATGGCATESRDHDHDPLDQRAGEGGAPLPHADRPDLPASVTTGEVPQLPEAPSVAPNPTALSDLPEVAGASVASPDPALVPDLPEAQPVAACDGAASYDPSADWTAQAVPARPRQQPQRMPTEGARQHAAAAWRAEQEKEAWAHARAAALIEPSDVGEQMGLVDEAPAPALVLQPPSDPELRREYYMWRGKAKKATSDRQRRFCEGRARALMELRPAEPVAAPAQEAAPAPPSQARASGASRRSARRAPAQPATVEQAALWDLGPAAYRPPG